MNKPKKSTESQGSITIRIVKLAALTTFAALTLAARAQGVPATTVGPAPSEVATPATPATPSSTGSSSTPAIFVGPGDVLTPVAAIDVRAEKAWFLAVGQRGRNGPESYVVPVSGAARIAEVRQYLADRAAGTEKRPLIPTVTVALGSDTDNRNHSAPGAPLWGWHVTEVLSFTRYTRPEVEPAVVVPGRDSAPSDIEWLLRGIAAPPSTFALRDYPIAMELRAEYPRSVLANVSDRGTVGVGGEVKVTGFVIDGGSPRSVVIRVLGPSLAAFGVNGVLANPRFEVYQGSEKIAENDDWATGNLNRPHVTVMPGTPPFNLIPNEAREPALELSLPPGAYTVIVSGVSGTTGVALTEVHLL